MKPFLFFIAALLAAPCNAKTMYKCSTGNVVDYQFRPCKEGYNQDIIEDKPVDEESEQSGQQIEEGIKVGDLSVLAQEADSIGNQWYAAKVTVYNRGKQPRKVFVKFKALDASGFEIDDVLLSGTIQPNSYEELTHRTNMKVDEFSRVNKWVLEK